MITSHPACARAKAQARPSPRLDAQTMALRPAMPRSMANCLLCWRASLLGCDDPVNPIVDIERHFGPRAATRSWRWLSQWAPAIAPPPGCGNTFEIRLAQEAVSALPLRDDPISRSRVSADLG